MSNEIKIGDKVRVSKDAPKLIFGSCDIDKNVAAINVINDERAEIKVWIVPTKYLVKVDAEKKPNVGSIKIPVEVDLTDSYWDAYAADLAKEVALKVANKYNGPKEAAEYAVLVAKAVVENLKKTNSCE